MKIMRLITSQLASRLSLILLPILLGCRERCFDEVPSLAVTVASTTVKEIRWGVLDKTAQNYPLQSIGSLVREKRIETQLPLNFNAAETRYTLQADNGRIDTLTVRYALKTVFASQKCGYVLTVQRPAQGNVVRFTRDSVKAVRYANDAYIPGAMSSHFLGTSVFIVITL